MEREMIPPFDTALLAHMSTSEIRNLARTWAVEGAWRMTRQELIDEIIFYNNVRKAIKV